MIALSEDMLDAAREAASGIDADAYLYNGTIQRSRDLAFIDAVSGAKRRPSALLVLVTNGGDPDAAYKMTRYLQDRYDRFSVLISGLCKSAGTLVALGAHELIFTSFGELGPVDIQLTKVDRLDQMQSGLTIQDALAALESRATESFSRIVQDYIAANNGLISFALASKAAAEFVTRLYGPVFGRIDPEEVGARSRSMRIATEYGKRLSLKSQNLKPDTLRLLAEKYPSHSFVIDEQEACSLFQRVRSVNDAEERLVAALGRFARFEVARGSDFVFSALSKRDDAKGDSENAAETDGGRIASTDGADPARADGSAIVSPPRSRGGRSRKRLANGSENRTG